MKITQKCLPLEIVKEGSWESNLCNVCKAQGIIPEDTARTDVINYVLTIKGYECRKKIPELDPVIMKLAGSMAGSGLLPATTAEGKQRKIDPVIELLDQMVFSDLLMTWRETKQIYKIDKAFMVELSRTENLMIPASSLRHLPSDIMYIDFSDSGFLYPVAGTFVYVVKDIEDPQVVMLMATNDKVLFSFYSSLQYDENRIAEIPDNQVPTSDFVAFDMSKAGDVKAKDYANDPRAKIVRAIYQILVFLSAQNTDIQENPVSRKYHREFTVPKDRFSEVRTWDVGVRYGKAISFSKKEGAHTGGTEEADAAETNTGSKKKRKPVRPHLRCAHWQRYRVGKGRKETKMNWILPTIVGAGREEDLPAVIRELQP